MISDFKMLQDFFDKPVAVKAASPLKKGVTVNVDIIETGESFHVVKEDNMRVYKEKGKNPDATIEMTINAVEYLISFETDNIGEYGIEILKMILEGDQKKRIIVHYHVGLIKITTHGYFGVLKLGGSGIWQYLSSHGLSNIGKIRQFLKKETKK